MNESVIRYWRIRVTGQPVGGRESFVRDIIVPAPCEIIARLRAENCFRVEFTIVGVMPLSSSSFGLAERPSQDPAGYNADAPPVPYWVVDGH
jgi:hypothetical protein